MNETRNETDNCTVAEPAFRSEPSCWPSSEAFPFLRNGRRGGYVYFISDGGEKIKIGFSGAPKLRLKTLQCGSPKRLSIIATFPAMETAEPILHARFDHLKSHNEWFVDDGEIKSYIAFAGGSVQSDPYPMSPTPADIEALQVQLDELTQWVNANALAKAGTQEFRRKSLTRRYLIDLIANDGGTPEDRAEVMRRINDPDFGKIE